MTTVTLADAQARLGELIDRLAPGEELVITRDDKPVAKLVSPAAPGAPRKPGSAVGRLTVVSDDDDHLKDFAEYM